MTRVRARSLHPRATLVALALVANAGVADAGPPARVEVTGTRVRVADVINEQTFQGALQVLLNRRMSTQGDELFRAPPGTVLMTTLPSSP